jgi:hypothetical protein
MGLARRSCAATIYKADTAATTIVSESTTGAVCSGAGEGNRTLVISLEGLGTLSNFTARSDKLVLFRPLEPSQIFVSVRMAALYARPSPAPAQPSLKADIDHKERFPVVTNPAAPGAIAGAPVSDSADSAAPSRPLADAVRAMLADAARRQRGPK